MFIEVRVIKPCRKQENHRVFDAALLPTKGTVFEKDLYSDSCSASDGYSRTVVTKSRLNNRRSIASCDHGSSYH
jgi:hypothetical protein